jgi:hypothetical protein
MTQQDLAHPTPGYDRRLQIAFTLKDGAPRAWILSELDGRAVLVSTNYEIAKEQVERGRADELPLGVISGTQSYGRQVALVELLRGSDTSCGCQHEAAGAGAGAGVLVVDAAVAQRTETVVVGRGRLVAGASVGEPLLAVAEGTENRVACCGPSPATGAAPNAVVFDRYRPAPGGGSRGEGGYAVAESTEYALPASYAARFTKKTPHCLPWVRVTRDPERFRACLAAARALGPIDTPKQVVKLVGPFLMQQDQEVFLVVMLDGQCQVRGISEIARGARDRVDVPVPDVLRVAIVEGCTGVVVVHNHPSGVRKPSDSDKELTETLRAALETVHLFLLDHVIVAGDKYYSFAESGGKRGYKK